MLRLQERFGLRNQVVKLADSITQLRKEINYIYEQTGMTPLAKLEKMHKDAEENREK